MISDIISDIGLIIVDKGSPIPTEVLIAREILKSKSGGRPIKVS